MGAPAWLKDWKPHIKQDTGHYVLISTPSQTPTAEAIYVLEHLYSVCGLRYIAENSLEGGLICEKVK